MSELMRSGSTRIESIGRGAANLNMPSLNVAAALPSLLRPASALASGRLSRCRTSAHARGGSPEQMRGGLGPEILVRGLVQGGLAPRYSCAD